MYINVWLAPIKSVRGYAIELKRKKDITLHILPPVKYEKSEEKTQLEMEIELKDIVYAKMNKYFQIIVK